MHSCKSCIFINLDRTLKPSVSAHVSKRTKTIGSSTRPEERLSQPLLEPRVLNLEQMLLTSSHVEHATLGSLSQGSLHQHILASQIASGHVLSPRMSATGTRSWVNECTRYWRIVKSSIRLVKVSDSCDTDHQNNIAEFHPAHSSRFSATPTFRSPS